MSIVELKHCRECGEEYTDHRATRNICDKCKKEEERIKLKKDEIHKKAEATRKKFGRIPSQAVIVGYDDLGDWVSDIEYVRVLTIGKYTLGELGSSYVDIIRFFEDYSE